MGTVDVVGWASSIVLVFTIAKQVHKQWKSGTSEGVSKWLFLGQITASVGFTVYSWFVHNWVFVVTNALMLLNAVAAMDQRFGVNLGGKDASHRAFYEEVVAKS